MTLPLPKKNIFGTPSTRNNWLERYLGVEKVADQQLYRALTQATRDIDASMAALAKKQGKTAKVRRLQMALAHKEIRAVMNDLYGNKIDRIIRNGHSRAAAAAVDATLKDEQALLKKIFPIGNDAEEYAKSLRLTARRNIDATMTRVLQSQIPLSQRVWNSRALAQGQVDRAIAGALARGDSYEQLAKAVHHLVDPDTPGGVTYAAKRLARTEINNAFHAQSIRDAQEHPWVTQMRWHLSKRHMNDAGDPCEAYALQGLFPIEQVPDKPHPHCRCFVAPEPVDDATFDRMLDSGQMDDYLDKFIEGDSPGPTDIAPAPPEDPTTKASQPAGWTGPLVAKAAANKDVRTISDSLYLGGMDIAKSRQLIREGSRTVQVKGYKGGLSSPGKQAFLGQLGKDVPDLDASMAFDIGREMTARVAYANPSAKAVYRQATVSDSQLLDLLTAEQGQQQLSLPLSTFEPDINRAFRYGDSTAKGTKVVFEVKSGAKVAEVADSRMTMGTFDIESIVEKSAPEGGKYRVVRLVQKDVREWDPTPSRGTPIADWEFVSAEDATVAGPVVKPAAKKPVKANGPARKAKTFAQKVEEATDVPAIRDLLEDKYPTTRFPLYKQDIDLPSMKEVAVTVDEQFTRHPIIKESLEVVEIWEEDRMGAGLAHVQPTRVLTNSGVPITFMRINARFARDYAYNKRRMRDMEDDKWLVPTASGVAERPMAKTITHEFGHVLDWATTMFEDQDPNRRRLGERLLKWFLKEERPEFKGARLKEQRAALAAHLRWGAAPSRYSASDPNAYGFHYAELVSEAYADVEFNGYGKAKASSKVVYDWLMEQEASPSAVQ